MQVKNKLFEMMMPGDGFNYRRTEILSYDETTNELIGHLSLDIFIEYTAITWVYVKPESRNKGIGTSLLEDAWKITKSNGIKQMGLVVDKSSEQNNLIKYYEKHGFIFYEELEKGGMALWKTEK